MNFILDTDSYKLSHFLQYPPNTTKLFSYVESRGGRYDKTVFFGLQYILKEYLTQRITVEQVLKGQKFAEAHGVPYPLEGLLYIANELDGKWPVKIRAVKEGSVIPTHNILMSVESTDPKVPWVVSWLETSLLRVWYPITVATQSWHIRQLIMKYLEDTSDDAAAEINFKLHDFGSRGVSSQESAMIGGAAHLVNFMGSDTIAGVWMANEYYNSPMAGFSIPAAEHSSITSWGKENEANAYRNMLNQFAKPGSLVAVVSDSYDLWNAITNLWGGELKEEVVNSGATVIIRPDSGHPATVVLECLKLLDEKFGHTINTKGYKVLNNVRVIQGDGINEESIREILGNADDAGYSATNIAFGMGGALLQQVNRDTQKFAYKCSLATVDGKEIDVFKDPVTDPGKRSKKGRLDLWKDSNDNYWTVNSKEIDNSVSQMVTVFENGELLVEYTLDEIRERAAKG
jgi:nicotinamide phosphoribosyltransferase